MQGFQRLVQKQEGFREALLFLSPKPGLLRREVKPLAVFCRCSSVNGSVAPEIRTISGLPVHKDYRFIARIA